MSSFRDKFVKNHYTLASFIDLGRISTMEHLYIKTHGCQMNDYDSKKIQDLLHESHQLSPVKVAEEADVILINTCSIREKPQENLFSELGRWAKIKAKNPNVIIGVGGCVASQEGNIEVSARPMWILSSHKLYIAYQSSLTA